MIALLLNLAWGLVVLLSFVALGRIMARVVRPGGMAQSARGGPSLGVDGPRPHDGRPRPPLRGAQISKDSRTCSGLSGRTAGTREMDLAGVAGAPDHHQIRNEPRLALQY